MNEPDSATWIEVRFEDGEALAIHALEHDQNGFMPNGYAAILTLYVQARRVARVERKLSWLSRIHVLLSVVMTVAVVSMVNTVLATALRGSSLGAALAVVVILALPVILVLFIIIGICWMCVCGLLDHVEDEMRALRRSEARFRYPRPETNGYQQH